MMTPRRPAAFTGCFVAFLISGLAGCGHHTSSGAAAQGGHTTTPEAPDDTSSDDIAQGIVKPPAATATTAPEALKAAVVSVPLVCSQTQSPNSAAYTNAAWTALTDDVKLQYCLDHFAANASGVIDVALPQYSLWTLSHRVVIHRSHVSLHTQYGGLLVQGSTPRCATVPNGASDPVFLAETNKTWVCATLAAGLDLRFYVIAPQVASGKHLPAVVTNPPEYPATSYPTVWDGSNWYGMLVVDGGSVISRDATGFGHLYSDLTKTITGVSVNNLIVDGRGPSRELEAAKKSTYVCNTMSYSGCANIIFHNCSQCTLSGNISMNAAGGDSASEADAQTIPYVYNTSAAAHTYGGTAYANEFVDVPGFAALSNVFYRNGQAFFAGADVKHNWSSGSPPNPLTGLGDSSTRASNNFEVRAVSLAPNSSMAVTVDGNDTVDASDGGMCFVVWPGQTMVGDVANNHIYQQSYALGSSAFGFQSEYQGSGNYPALPPLYAGSFGVGPLAAGQTESPAKSLVLHDNLVDCDSRPGIPWVSNFKKCIFGIGLGSNPWTYDSKVNGPSITGGLNYSFSGGRYRNNKVNGARVAIQVSGAGTAAGPVYVGYQLVTDSAAGLNIEIQDNADYFPLGGPGVNGDMTVAQQKVKAAGNYATFDNFIFPAGTLIGTTTTANVYQGTIGPVAYPAYASILPTAGHVFDHDGEYVPCPWGSQQAGTCPVPNAAP